MLTVTLPPGVGAEPMVKPVSVTVTAVLAASAVPPVIMTMDVAPGAPDTMEVPLVDREAFGDAVEAKKLEGYFKVTEEGLAPPAVGVKVKVADTAALPATRKSEAMMKVTDETEPPIVPESTVSDVVGSTLVCTVREVFPAVGAPMVRPKSATVTAVLAASAVPPVVMMMDELPGASDTRVAPFADKEAFGVEVDAKKPDG